MTLTEAEKHERKKEAMVWRLKAMSPGNQINDVAAAFQKLVKMRHADEFGMCTCFTCDAAYPWNDKRMNAGHFVGRQYRVTVFDERNCHPQCVFCNSHRNGNLSVYHERMVKKYGPLVVEQLTSSKQESRKWSADELAELKIKLMAQIRQEAKRL